MPSIRAVGFRTYCMRGTLSTESTSQNVFGAMFCVSGAKEETSSKDSVPHSARPAEGEDSGRDLEGKCLREHSSATKGFVNSGTYAKSIETDPRISYTNTPNSRPILVSKISVYTATENCLTFWYRHPQQSKRGSASTSNSNSYSKSARA